MTCQQEALSQLRQAGFRLTPQRAMVLEAVYHSDGHLTTDEVFDRVRAYSAYVDLSTVYRTLLFLKQNSLIGELRLDGEPVRYEAVRSGQEHHHAICSECGRMLEIDPADLISLVNALREKHGFQANLIHVTIPGLCADCAARAGD